MQERRDDHIQNLLSELFYTQMAGAWESTTNTPFTGIEQHEGPTSGCRQLTFMLVHANQKANTLKYLLMFGFKLTGG